MQAGSYISHQLTRRVTPIPTSGSTTAEHVPAESRSCEHACRSLCSHRMVASANTNLFHKELSDSRIWEPSARFETQI